MPTKENNPCENAVSCGGLALGLALAPRTVRVDLNKLTTLTDSASALFTAPVIRYAIEGFLANGSPEMPYDLFGRIVSECHVDPHDFLPDPPKQNPEPAPEWSASIEVSGDRLKMTVRHNGEELVYGKSYVQDTDDLGMMQAISYAAHICYKMVQQRSM